MTSTPSTQPIRHRSKRVIVLGWKPTEVIHALLAHGAEVVCVCEPTDLDEAGLSQLPVQMVPSVSINDADQVFAALARAGVSVTGDTLVCTADEYPLVTASIVGEALGARCWPVSRALAMRDKFVQKQLVRAAGIPAAQTHQIDSIADLDRVPFSGPYVVKPFDGAGVRRTVLVPDATAVQKPDVNTPDGGPWLVESYVDGAEMHMDGVVRNGRLQLISVSRYLNNVIDFRAGGLVGSTILHPDEFAELYGRVTSCTTSILSALNHQDGVFHLELFENDGSLTFGECAGRVGGGRVDTSVQLQFGVDLHDEWARAMIGIPSAAHEGALSPHSFGWVHLPAVAGRVATMPAVQEIEARPGVQLVQMKATVGGVMANTDRDSNARAGRVVVMGRDAAETEGRLRSLSEWFRAQVRVEPAPA